MVKVGGRSSRWKEQWRFGGGKAEMVGMVGAMRLIFPVKPVPKSVRGEAAITARHGSPSRQGSCRFLPAIGFSWRHGRLLLLRALICWIRQEGFGSGNALRRYKHHSDDYRLCCILP